MKKGKLIRVTRPDGSIVKMYEADAAAKGYITSPQDKSQPPAENKMRSPAENKAPEPETAVEPADDFTAIAGIGPATARALAANGITTFSQLYAAGELDYLTAAANAAIDKWRQASG